MMYLCTLGGDDGRDYYFDFHTLKTYSLSRAKYTKEKGKPKITSTHVILFAGPCATLTTSLFRGRQVGMDDVAFSLFILFLVGVVVFECYVISSAQRTLENYITSNDDGEFYDLKTLSRYFSYGTRYHRLGVFIYLIISCLIVIIASIAFISTYDASAMLFMIVGTVMTAGCIKILYPIQIIKFKLYLRRCKKECQKK